MNKMEYKAQLFGDDKSFSIILYDGEKDESGAAKRYATISFFKDGMLVINKEGAEEEDGVSSLPVEGIDKIFDILGSLGRHIRGETVPPIGKETS